MPVVARISGTDAALAAVAHLTATYGPLMFFQSGGCCDGSSPICLPDGELAIGPNDLLLGRVGGAAFYIDAEQFHRWKEPRFTLDVREGSADGFSLEGLDGVHFVTHSTGCEQPR